MANTHRDIEPHDVERVAIAYALLTLPENVDPITWLARGGPEVDAVIERFRQPAADALRDEWAEACEAAGYTNGATCT